MELASPITIYWDLPPDPPENSQLQRICAEISNCRPLMLQLFSNSASPSAGLLFVLKQLQNSGMAISLTTPVRSFDTLSANLLNESGLKELLLYTESMTDLLEMTDSGVRSFEKASPGISFSTNRTNWRQLSEVVSWCKNNGITRLVLPMQRLYNNERPFFITVAEQKELADALGQAGGAQDLNLTIHDPFLWRAFNPALPFPQAGCQAANTMIAIAPDGGVYPCPTLPVQLGSLSSSSLKEIISAPLKKQFRSSLLQVPGQCLECSEVAVCRGGCRGRGFVIQGTLGGIDPACQ